MDTDATNKKIYTGIFRRKDLDKLVQSVENKDHKLKRVLGAFDLVVLGIGTIIGAGIFTLAGTAAAGSEGHVGAGPALILSFVLSGILCAVTGLCYAEFASMIPVAGSSYTYTYSTMGEFVAWVLAWTLILGLGIGNITIVCGWSGYLMELLKGYQAFLHLPDWLANPPLWMIYDFYSAKYMYIHNMNIPADEVIKQFPMLFNTIPFSVNLPAVILIIVTSILLYIGIEESAHVATVMVLIKVAVIIFFIIFGAFYVEPENWTPFMPNGWPGVFIGAFLVFFAYVGFEIISTTAEEAKNPQRDLPIGILGSLTVCTILYILVALVLTGMVYWEEINTHAPIAAAMNHIGKNWMAGIISIGAVVGLFSVILVQLLGLTRIIFAIARDGLLPKVFSKIHPKYKTPHIATVIVAIATIIGTLFFDINKSAELANIGVLAAFAMVCLGVLILRYMDPKRERPFRAPLFPFIPVIGFILNAGLVVYTFVNPESPLTYTLYFYIVWTTIGLFIYFGYGMHNSTLKAELEKELKEQNNNLSK